MKRKTPEITIKCINDFIGKFVLMTSEERIAVIENHDKLSNIEQVALIQCRKYMTSKEKRAYSSKIKGSQDESFEK